MKIYTRTGDAGETSLFAGGRRSKDDVRLHAYGTVDELNSVLGMVLSADVSERIRVVIARVQSELFNVGADLATPLSAEAKWIVRVQGAMTARLEGEIDVWQEALPALTTFILPGGSPAGAMLHLARTVCRRAERWTVQLGETEAINEEILRYLNRLSDWLFVLSRAVNQEQGVGEQIWESPGRHEGGYFA